jgi:hypothetical protein
MTGSSDFKRRMVPLPMFRFPPFNSNLPVIGEYLLIKQSDDTLTLWRISEGEPPEGALALSGCLAARVTSRDLSACCRLRGGIAGVTCCANSGRCCGSGASDSSLTCWS